MTAAELFAAYPRVHRAVSYVELFLCANSLDDRDLFAMILAEMPRADPGQVADWIRKTVDDEIKINDHGDLIQIQAARSEMNDPQFVAYIAGKMGAV